MPASAEDPKWEYPKKDDLLGVFLAHGLRWPLYSRAISERIFPLEFEPREQFQQRQKKLEQIQALGLKAYPHEFRWTHTIADLASQFHDSSKEQLEEQRREVRVAGRVMSMRLMGKAGFAHLQGSGKRIQIY